MTNNINVLICYPAGTARQRITRICTEKGVSEIFHAGDVAAARTVIEEQDRLDLIVWGDIDDSQGEVEKLMRLATAKFYGSRRICAHGTPEVRKVHTEQGFKDVGPMSLITTELPQFFLEMTRH